MYKTINILRILSILALYFTNSFVHLHATSSVIIEEIDEAKDSQSSSTFSFPFQIGFEFQESGDLCPWALNDTNFQKKNFFGVYDQVGCLWKIVIDTTDIEFVTKPFPHTAQERLETCLNSIVGTFSQLRSFLNGQSNIPFKFWVESIEQHLENQSLYLKRAKHYDLIKDKLLIRPEDWNPKFAPQVTLHHPLEYTIPLYFCLFGFDSSYMSPFSSSLPLRNYLLDAQQNADSELFDHIIQAYNQKLNGLVFLHALTLFQMSPATGLDHNDKDALESTYTAFSKFHQVDAKMALLLMSRRPFSSMYRDCKFNHDYEKYFKEVMSHNNGFSRLYRIPEAFNLTNYAEQYMDMDTGKPLSLTKLINLFEEKFKLNNTEILEKLLRNGIVSTIMINNINEIYKVNELPICSILSDYYNQALKSVQRPQYNYTINLNNFKINVVKSNHDALSPPWFQDEENSMGRINDEMPENEKQYGEAIIEIRGIRNVQSWFLKKAQIDLSVSGNFLTTVNEDLTNQAKGLFNFIKGLNYGNNYNDYYLGMTFALRKY